jgi:hypothetical protein
MIFPGYEASSFLGWEVPVAELSITRKPPLQLTNPLTVRTFCYKYTKFYDIFIAGFLVMDGSVTCIFGPGRDGVSCFGGVVMRFRVLEKLSCVFVVWS